MKACNQNDCKEENPTFHKNKANRDGLANICTKCKTRKYSDSAKAYKLKHKNEVAEYNKELRLKNIDKYKDYQMCWNSDNKDIKKAHSRKRRAMKNSVNENFTVADEKYILKLYENKCFNCSCEKNLTFDHTMPLSKGYAMTRENCTLLCNSCNSSKHNKIVEHFYSYEQIEELRNKYMQNL